MDKSWVTYDDLNKKVFTFQPITLNLSIYKKHCVAILQVIEYEFVILNFLWVRDGLEMVQGTRKGTRKGTKEETKEETFNFFYYTI